MKKAFSAILTLSLLLFLNYFLSSILKVSFIDMSLIVGVLFTTIIGFFSTEDNIYNRFLDYWTAIAIDKETTRNYNLRFFKSIPFFISMIYTILALIISIYIYWDYFF
ncbi:hypothetical protein [Paraclostridium sordellii]|uniref:hypothetical protein n=1 Tax=Paraclostridium sordellii TaxID=1505 RepID=UPI0006DC1D3E|nr:hypothetical protein [Paeniclostridium sordellii]QYE99411.1 hypothetical protein KZ987_07885 [Paeniclostridium sordellii]